MKNERLETVNILIQLIEKGQSLSTAFQVHQDVPPLTKAICFGVCRYYDKLSSIADFLIKKRPKPVALWIIILTGLYQLMEMDIPAYAAVKETVNLLPAFKLNWAKGLTNAILRRYDREKEAIAKALQSDQNYQYSHPDWLYKKIQQDWPNDWRRILSANNAHPPMSLRVNLKKITREAYLTKLKHNNIQASPHRHANAGVTLLSPMPIHQLPGFLEGEVSVQDEAAQLAAQILDLKPNQRVLDACAAPGGKTCHILEIQNNLRTCVALEIDEKRLQRIRENLSRLDLQAHVIQGDASSPSSWWDGELFDSILLDAPCSATGVIRRHPDIKILRTPDDIQQLVNTQKQILDALWPLLKEDGLLLYVTCSILKDENEKQIEQFIKKTPNAQCVGPHWQFASAVEFGNRPHVSAYGCQLLPGEDNQDLFFYSMLRKMKQTKNN